MTSTSAADGAPTTALRRGVRPVLVVAFWLGVWQVVALVVGQELVLASPGAVAVRAVELVRTADAWASIAHSSGRITGGFAIGLAAGMLTAVAAAASSVVDALLTPAVRAVRAAPVVSFIILVLIWARSDQLAIIISALMVLPVVHTNVGEGIRNRDRSLLEVAAVHRVPVLRRLVAIDVPAVLPYVVAACRTGVGLAWKSGVAAEVIGLPDGSIGERLYDAKLFLRSADLFAWTAVVITLSVVVERVVTSLLARLAATLGHGRTASIAAGTRAQSAAAPTGAGPAPPEGADLPSAVHVVQVRGAPPGGVRVRGATVAYGEVVVLDQVDLDVRPGTVTALVGPNGSGKTTLGRVVLGLVTPLSGTVTVARGATRAAVFQDDRLCEQLSAIGNVRLVLDRGAGARAVADLRAVGLDDATTTRPVRELSGGQRRRVAVVRALATEADVVVLDEPFTGLDPTARSLTLEYARRRCAGRAVVLITHDPADVAWFAADVIRLGS